MNANLEARPLRITPRAALMTLAGVAAGGLAGWWIGRLIKHGDVLDPGRWSWADATALAIGAAMVVLGTGITLNAFGNGLRRVTDPTGRRSPTPAQRTYYRLQAAVLLLAGLMLGAPPVLDAVAGPLDPTLGAAGLTGIAALFLLQCACNLAVWLRSDELIRRMMAETSALSFWIVQGALFLWAAGERLGVAPALSAWDLTVLLMAIYLAVSTTVSVVRG